jgi:catechol 2,3-dioxygenase-like lactoylglutathione lyase family enzyme
MRTADVSRLERFYVEVLCFPVIRRDEARGSVWLDADGAVLMIEPAEVGEPRIAPGTRELLAFVVADKEAWRSRLPGVEAETQHTLYFRDPDGRRLAVSDYPLPAR